MKRWLRNNDTTINEENEDSLCSKSGSTHVNKRRKSSEE